MIFARYGSIPSKTPEQVSRLTSPKVGYMEIIDQATGFSCGRCVHFSSGQCTHKLVLSPVSNDHGCCNLFYPSNGGVIFPR